MADRAEYDVRTLADIALIPEDAFPRFLAEFPLLVETARGLVNLVREVHKLAAIDPPTREQLMDSMANVKWVDDDKGNVDVRLSAENEKGEEVRLADVHANWKTGDFSGNVNHDAFRDSGRPPQGGDGEAAPGEAGQSGQSDSEGIAR